MKPNVLCIVGPTASGKTALSVELALHFDGEIVSADAVSVYRRLDVGSAKPSEAERKGVPHFLLDCADITDESFTVSTFRQLARQTIDDILARKKLPIVVGGSGLYLDAIFGSMSFSTPSDPLIRADLEKAYNRDQNAFFESLRASDPVTALRLHPNDRKRVVRAMEVFRLTGQPFSSLNRDFESAQSEDETYRTIRIGLSTDRRILYERINSRVDRMIEYGLLSEAFSLFDIGLTPDRYRAMQSIGYSQLYDVYQGKTTLADAIEKIKLDTRHFAKRQITWFKRNPNTTWIDPLNVTVPEIIRQVTELLNGDSETD